MSDIAAATIHMPARHALAHVHSAAIGTDGYVLEISDRSSLHVLLVHGTAGGLEALLESALRQVRDAEHRRLARKGGPRC